MNQRNGAHTMSISVPRILRRLAAAALLAGIASITPAIALAQQAYANPAAAAQAFHDAVAAEDPAAMRKVLGTNWKRFVPTDDIGRDELQAFLAAWDKGHKIQSAGYGKAALAVGDGGWTLPIPLVQSGNYWHFDPRAGADEMRTRRIGRNELAAMQAVLAYFDAQKEYAQRDHDGSGVLAYAQRMASTPGQHDGLYWPDAGEGSSPLGPLYGDVKPGQGYHGYHFKILESQGPAAPGGAYDYVIAGRMRSGFALIAWPIEYGQTGVTSFMISHDGALYQQDLGPGTNTEAPAVRSFNPDAGWSRVDAP